MRYGNQIEQVILEKVFLRGGEDLDPTVTPEVATDRGVELSDVFITLKPGDQWQRATTQGELVTAMEKELGSLPGMRLVYAQPIEMRVNEMIAGIS